MYPSRYNLILKSPEPGEYALMNFLSGSFDLATKDEVDQLSSLGDGNTGQVDASLVTYLENRGYVYRDRMQEDLLLAVKESEFQDSLRHSPTQVFLIPTYNCNLACRYCFQQGIQEGHQVISRAYLDAFFGHMQETFREEEIPPFITLFGGEPLINSPQQRESIDYICRRSRELGYELAVVTNGYHLSDYVETLAMARIKEVQVTVDGPQAVHDTRRPTRAGRGTYESIMRGIELSVQKGFPINFRVVVDKENLPSLVPLAEELDHRGWLDLGAARFKTQLGRNYELFQCSESPEDLFSQVELWRSFVEVSRTNPVLKKFHQPEFKGIRHLALTGELPDPSFDTCPAGKKEWVYDLNGHIFGCTASCGREGYQFGNFFPQLKYDRKVLQPWIDRNVNTIPECRDCDVSLVCGGGCGVVANERNGSVLSPDCRPIKELLSLGLEYYWEEIVKMADGRIPA